MNKFFTKVAAFSACLAMAIGVGVAVGSKDDSKEVMPVQAATSLGNTTINFGTTSGYWAPSSSGSTKTDSLGQTWTCTYNANGSTTSNASYYQLGSNNKKLASLSITSSNFTQNVKLTSFTFVGAAASNKTVISYNLQASGSNLTGASASIASGTTGGTTATASFSGNQIVNSGSNIGITFSPSAAGFRLVSLSYTIAAATTQYTVGGTISNGALSSTASVDSGSALNITLNPSEHYHLPSSLTSVTMGGNALVAGTGYTYNNSTGAISIASVTGNVVINATCPQDSKYDVIYTAGTYGSGTFTVSNQWAGSYTLPAYSSISGSGKVNANDGYAFKDYTVGGETKNPGETISLSSLTNVTVNFKVQPKEAKYEPTSATAASMTEGIAPTGSGITFNNTYTNNKFQITGGNSMAWTLTGYTGYNIKSIKAYARNNKSSGAAIATLTNNSVSVTPLEKSNFSGLGDTYAEYEILKSKIEVKGNVVLTFTASENSLFCDYILVEWEQSNVLSKDLIIDNPTASFTVGDTFEIGDTVYANYSISGDVDVTSEVTLDLAGVGTISEGDTITSDWVGTKEVGVYYEDEGGAEASAAYDITVSYAKVTSVEITNYPSTGELPKDGTFTFGATVLPATANPAVKWSASSETLVENDDFYIDEDTGELTLTASEGGTITITATTVGKTAGDVTLSDTYDLEVTGDPVVTLNHSALAGYSGKSGSLTAEAANFGGAVTYSWSSNNACVTVPNNNVATNTLTYVSAGTAIITVTATYQSQSASATCTVTVTASQVTSVTWTSASDMTVYSGSTALNAAKISSWGPHYEMNNGDSGTVSSNYTVQLNGTAYTLGTALEAGTYSVSLTYGGETTSVNPTLTVVQRLNAINSTSEGSKSWSDDGTTNPFDGTSGTTTLDGITWSFTRTNTATNHAGAGVNRYIQFGTKAAGGEDVELRTSNITGTITSVSVLCATGSGTHTISISVGGNSYLSQTAPTWTNNAGDTVTGTGSSSGEIVISFTGGAETAEGSGKALYIRTITVNYSSTSNVANITGHEEAQAKVVEFAQYMNTQMNGAKVCSGDMSNLGTAWSNVEGKYNTLFGASSTLSSDELAYAKNMLANASASWNESHDSDEQYCLERAMKTYEWCVSNYSGTCNAFMSSVRPVSANTRVSLLGDVSKNANTIAIVVITSLVAVAAIGGYFFLRKRKENI